MKKRNIIYYLFVILFCTSCLDEDPQYTTNSKVVYESEQSAQLALNGIYGFMAAQGSFAQIVPEINAAASGIGWGAFNPSNNDSQYINGTIAVATTLGDMVWTGLYRVVANCNIFIESCNGSNADWKSKKNMVAQAKFMRAVCYYHLFSMFGEVPLRLTSASLELIDMARPSRQQMIDQMLKDWTEASLDLIEKPILGMGTPTAPTKYSAYAYITKLYWILGCNAWAVEQGDAWGVKVLKPKWKEMKSSHDYFVKAKEYGDLVISNGGFELEPNFNTLFNGKRVTFSKEFVFTINTTMNTTVNVGYNSLHWTFSPQNSSQGETWGRIQPNKAYFDWANGTYQDDPRLKSTFMTKWNIYVNKLPDKLSTSYPYVRKDRIDTIGWKDSIVRPERPPIKFPIIVKTSEIIDSINYRDFEKYKDPCNPRIEELDSLLKDAFARTKGASDWNINDWPYFGKHFTLDCSGRYANNNLYVYRYADFLLLMADVENELGNSGKAVTLANQVLQRARQSAKPASTYPKDWTDLDPNKIRESIFHERLFELAIEFDMFNDTRRRGIEWRKKLLERNNNHPLTKACYEYGIENGYKSPWREYLFPNDKQESWEDYLIRNQLLPIPQEEMSSNNFISLQDQNPGY